MKLSLHVYMNVFFDCINQQVHIYNLIENPKIFDRIFSSKSVTETFILYISTLKLGTGGVQGQVKGQRLMGLKAVNDSIGLATCQSKIYEK